MQQSTATRIVRTSSDNADSAIGNQSCRKLRAKHIEVVWSPHPDKLLLISRQWVAMPLPIPGTRSEAAAHLLLLHF